MNGENQIQKAYESILSQDFEKAIEWFEKAIAAEPNNAAYHYKLSITYARSNKLSSAIEHASIAAQLEEENEAHRYHLQVLHARELVEKAQRQLSTQTEHAERAIFLLKEAIVLDPLAIEAYLILGEVFAFRNDYGRAYQTVMEAIRLEPNHELAKQQAARYQQKMNNRY
ncbi:tetratricopeptide repeat protein [Paenibacillus aceris]|uniref:Tetratricopeptide (TPR) repeat protein n=1 Tax=Paenibacillus aceris TaxID=869555 RepID=A0ABS4HTK0_9BACL|nr:tetratricopeptide repeat protein [Paenibacillus aceris]MBP1961934.1 tetratricopeptide (TPR) repeat protein [Paenibacillus aceris]NHW34215.1 tetratricopeptide repeat protein [Paenibacillus aceris]